MGRFENDTEKPVTIILASYPTYFCRMSVFIKTMLLALLPCAAFADEAGFQELWTKVGRTCLKCHKAGGDAEDSKFLLVDPRRATEPAAALANNRTALIRMARIREPAPDQPSRLLLKVVGELDHGGEDVLKADGPRYQLLADFVRRVQAGGAASDRPPRNEDIRERLFDNIVLVEPGPLLRRLTLSLGARLPTAGERSAIAKAAAAGEAETRAAFESILDHLLEEEAFYLRLAEGFEDIFLTRGYEGVPERVLSYNHFEKTRHWNQKMTFEHLPENERKKAGYKLADTYREAMLREPMELVKHIVRHDRPFTELVTADYIMVSPYTAKGYALFDSLKDRFEDPENPFEYIPAKIPALTARNGSVQTSETGFYPHAGMLSTFHYLRRYPTTDTNRNRLRARMVYQHFLGVDIMALAPRVNDAAAVDEKYAVPTMEAADCVVCHKVVDPLAGLFQDFQNKDNDYGPRKEGWFTDMFPPGLEGEALPDEQKWRALQWLGERTAKDPRFASTMVEHVWYILGGRKVLVEPQDIDDPLFDARHRAWRSQRAEIQAITRAFVADDYNLKTAFKAWAMSPFYRASHLKGTVDPDALTELHDIGLVHLLSPEQLERKIEAVFGRRWNKLQRETAILYGGINSETITERLTEPSGAMGAIQRMMANEIACRHVAFDFTSPRGERILFPGIDLDTLPGPATEAELRTAIVQLHQRILGREDAADSTAVDISYELFAGIVADAAAAKAEKGSQEKLDIYFCRGADDKRVADPHYTLRAWRAVVSYLLRQPEFLYE